MGRKMSPHGPSTHQNCIPEERYPCPQVPEEPGIGSKTGALKGPGIMGQWQSPCPYTEPLCPSAGPLLLCPADLFPGPVKRRRGFVGT